MRAGVDVICGATFFNGLGGFLAIATDRSRMRTKRDSVSCVG
jgi:hypothetical protein